mgnify:FL=1
MELPSFSEELLLAISDLASAESHLESASISAPTTQWCLNIGNVRLAVREHRRFLHHAMAQIEQGENLYGTAQRDKRQAERMGSPWPA